jgi:capsular polysaccharide biosynthesis protein
MRSDLAPWLAVLTLTAAGAAAAAGYSLTAPERYRATAQLLVAPVSTSDSTFAGIGVLRDTGGRRTAAANVAALVRAPQIVDAAAAQLGLKRSRQSLLDALHVHVVDSSDVVAVTAEDTSPDAAAQLANTFANALIAQRSASFQSELAAAIRRDRQLLARSSDPAGSISRRLTTLLGLQGRQDPTVRLASQAAAPASASWPNVPLLVGVGTGIGAAAGVFVGLLALGARARELRPSRTRAARRRAGKRLARAAGGVVVLSAFPARIGRHRRCRPGELRRG